jgi:hypothetical protein
MKIAKSDRFRARCAEVTAIEARSKTPIAFAIRLCPDRDAILVGPFMTYRVSGKSGIGTVVAVIVPTALDVVGKLGEFREDGLSEISVHDLEEKPVDMT